MTVSKTTSGKWQAAVWTDGGMKGIGTYKTRDKAEQACREQRLQGVSAYRGRISNNLPGADADRQKLLSRRWGGEDLSGV